MQACSNDELNMETNEWLMDDLDSIAALCLDNAAHVFYEQRSITARQLGYSTMTDLRDMAENDESFFDKKDNQVILYCHDLAQYYPMCLELRLLP